MSSGLNRILKGLVVTIIYFAILLFVASTTQGNIPYYLPGPFLDEWKEITLSASQVILPAGALLYICGLGIYLMQFEEN